MENIGKESETIEFKKSTSELKEAMIDAGAMLNKHGKGIIYFGVKNNGDVCGQEIGSETLNDIAVAFKNAIEPMVYPKINLEEFNNLKIIKVEFSGTELPYSTYGRYYKRVSDRAEGLSSIELKHMILNTDYTSEWENNLTEFGMEAIDNDSLHSFYNAVVGCGRLDAIDDYTDERLLSSLGLLRDNKLTNAGFYLFSNKEPIVLKTAIYMTDARLNFSDINRINTNIYNATDIAINYIKDRMKWRVEFDGTTKRIEIPEVPISAIREIVVNAFAHANYRSVTEHQITFTPSVIEIYNPGEFPMNYKPEDFVNNNLPSIARNKKILEILYRSKDVEAQGSGLRKTIELCNQYNVNYSYDMQSLGFKFIFSRTSEEEKHITSVIDYSVVNKTDMLVINVLNEHPQYSQEQIAIAIGKTKRTVQRSIERLKASGNIVRIGSARNGYWEVINK